jgi:REP element-mobilizing transposase RayT
MNWHRLIEKLINNRGLREYNMAYKFDKNSHSVYAMTYHFVQCIKYRRKVLDFIEIIEELKSRSQKIADAYGVEIVAIETDLDHVHMLFKAKPQTNLVLFISNWKSATSKALRNKFRKQIADKLWKDVFWSNSYCLITTGQVTLEQVKKYVESQNEKRT